MAATTALDTSSIAVTDNTSNYAQTNTCGTKIMPGDHCTISVTFTPMSTGTRQAALVINNNSMDLRSKQIVKLAGVATAH